MDGTLDPTAHGVQDHVREGNERGEPGLDWLAVMLQLNDTFYPTGAYAHSFGLEGMIHEGVVRDRETLRHFLVASTLPSLRQVEMPLVCHAWTALGTHDWAAVEGLAHLSSALRSTREVRAASEAIGRQRAELLARLHPHALAREYLEKAAARAWPHSAALSAALEARVLGSPLEAALASVYYAAVSGAVAAAMKLLRLGQNAAHALMAELLMQAAPLIRAARQVPRGEIGWFNPWLDIASARHETAAERLFIS